MQFDPRNDLERQLLAAHEGALSIEQFYAALLDAQVFMPVEDGTTIGGIQRSTHAKPLSIEAEDGTQVLILFTSPERAKGFISGVPGYGGGILAEFAWVLEKMGDAYGIALNPDSEYGVDLEPQTVQHLAKRAAEQQAAKPN